MSNLPARLVAGLLLCALAACRPASSLPLLATPGPVGEAPVVYPLLSGWHNGQAVAYYNLGANTPLDPADPTRVRTEPVWVFAESVNADGSPVMLDGQDSVFDTRRGEAAYTDLWQAVFVTPVAGYAPNSLTSAEALAASGLPAARQPMFVNCPEAPAGSSLADRALPLKDGWVRGEPIAYFDFGPTSPTPGKVYVFVTGFDDFGQPQLVGGQGLVFDAAPGTRGYSHFWRVQWVRVAADYRADSVRAAVGVDPGAVTESALVLNLPHK